MRLDIEPTPSADEAAALLSAFAACLGETARTAPIVSAWRTAARREDLDLDDLRYVR